MLWSRVFASAGVFAAASFAVYDEAENLLALCEPFELDWYSRVVTLAALFVVHSVILAAGALLIFRHTGRRRGFVGSTLEIAITVAVACVVGFGMALADPLLNFLFASACLLASACTEPGLLRSLHAALDQAARWPNTPVAVFTVTLFGLGAFFLQSVMQRESAPGRKPSEA